jgi:hypothetical protein
MPGQYPRCSDEDSSQSQSQESWYSALNPSDEFLTRGSRHQPRRPNLREQKSDDEFQPCDDDYDLHAAVQRLTTCSQPVDEQRNTDVDMEDRSLNNAGTSAPDHTLQTPLPAPAGEPLASHSGSQTSRSPPPQTQHSVPPDALGQTQAVIPVIRTPPVVRSPSPSFHPSSAPVPSSPFHSTDLNSPEARRNVSSSPHDDTHTVRISYLLCVLCAHSHLSGHRPRPPRSKKTDRNSG